MLLREKFEIHDTLNPKLWFNNKLKDDVKQKIVQIVEQFVSTCDVPLHIVDVHIVGSQASYNYTEYSDLDVHIISNFELVDCSKEILQVAYNSVKTKFNSDYDITIKDIDVELYVEDVKSSVTSNGIYSLYQDNWIKFPKKLTNVPDVDVSDEISLWKTKINNAISSNDSERIEKTIDDLYVERQSSLYSDGEYGKGNQLFKEIRNLGLLDKLKDSYKSSRSKELSLESLKMLHEDSRSSLLAKSKKSDKGFQRFKKRVKSRVANSVKQYNSIDMNKLFKKDILTVDIQVKGETDTYTVKISFGGFCELLQDQIKKQNGKLDFKAVTRALILGFNKDDVFIHCNCLHPDTKIKLLDGRCLTIKELASEFERNSDLYVYSTDSNGDFKPGKLLKVWKTGSSQDFIKVTLDNGKEILTTPEHPYMLRDGSYSIASKLVIGQSLMPLYFKDYNGYEQVKLNTTGKYHSVYKLVAEELLQEQILSAKNRATLDGTLEKFKYDVAIHHKDFIKSNNHPSNFDIMTAYEHWSYHNSLAFPNKPVAMQENIRKCASENAKYRNANPTDNMVEQRLIWQEKGKLRNYDSDRKQQQSEIAYKTIVPYMQNLTLEQKQIRSDISSKTALKNWSEGRYDTEKFHAAAKERGKNLQSPEVKEASHKGILNYWENLTQDQREQRNNQSIMNLRHAHERLRGVPLKESHKANISASRLCRSPESKHQEQLTRIKNQLIKLIENGLLVTEENYYLNRSKGAPRIDKYFNSIEDAMSYFELNHRIVNIERIHYDSPVDVYDLKVDTWQNFCVDADVILHNCPDATYRMNYWQTKNGITSGEPETRPSDITNPDDNLGSACKHVLLVLSNTSWLLKVGATIMNYIRYMEKHYAKLYADIIYPAIYGKNYEDPVQLDIFDDDSLETDTDTIDKSNEYARTKNQFKQGNKEGIRFASKNNDQQSFDIDNSPIETPVNQSTMDDNV